MKMFEMVSPSVRPVDDREGHLPFEPFTRVEWILTLLLVLICLGLPLGMILHYQHEMARMNTVAVGQVGHE